MKRVTRLSARQRRAALAAQGHTTIRLSGEGFVISGEMVKGGAR